VAEPELSYSFTCPSCAGTFSILLERIPPVQARFRCPHCKQPMDFPSREEARVYARLQVDAPPSASPKPAPVPAPAPAAVKTPPPAPPPPVAPPPARPSRMSARESSVAADNGSNQPPDSARFRVEKPGFESDEYARRALRNLIRTPFAPLICRTSSRCFRCARPPKSTRPPSAEPTPTKWLSSSARRQSGRFARTALRKRSLAAPPSASAITAEARPTSSCP
jgi:predicted Zn finger-like uncharacterized protein